MSSILVVRGGLKITWLGHGDKDGHQEGFAQKKNPLTWEQSKHVCPQSHRVVIQEIDHNLNVRLEVPQKTPVDC